MNLVAASCWFFTAWLYCLLQFYCSSASYLYSLKVVVYVTRFTPYWDIGQDIQSGCLFWAPPFFKGSNQRSFGVGCLERETQLFVWFVNMTWKDKRRKKWVQSKSLFTFHCLIFGFLNGGDEIWVLLCWKLECVPGHGPGWRK